LCGGNKASKEVPTKSGGKMACQGGGGKVELSFFAYVYQKEDLK